MSNDLREMAADTVVRDAIAKVPFVVIQYEPGLNDPDKTRNRLVRWATTDPTLRRPISSVCASPLLLQLMAGEMIKQAEARYVDWASADFKELSEFGHACLDMVGELVGAFTSSSQEG